MRHELFKVGFFSLNFNPSSYIFGIFKFRKLCDKKYAGQIKEVNALNFDDRFCQLLFQVAR